MSQSTANGNAVGRSSASRCCSRSRVSAATSRERSRDFFGDNTLDQAAPPQQQPRRRNFLEELFGGGRNQDNGDDTGYGDNGQYNGQDQVEDPAATQQQPSQYTIRTVCVSG